MLADRCFSSSFLMADFVSTYFLFDYLSGTKKCTDKIIVLRSCPSALGSAGEISGGSEEQKEEVNPWCAAVICYCNLHIVQTFSPKLKLYRVQYTILAGRMYFLEIFIYA